MDASDMTGSSRGWLASRDGVDAAGAGRCGRGSRSHGEPPQSHRYDERGAKLLLVQRVVCLSAAELPRVKAMFFALSDDGYTLPEIASFILTKYDTLMPQIRKEYLRKKAQRNDLICNPETRKTVIPENAYEADLILMLDDMDRAQREIDRKQQEIDRAQREVDREWQEVGGGLHGLSLDEYNAQTAAIIQGMGSGGDFGVGPFGPDPAHTSADWAGDVRAVGQPVEQRGKKKAQKAVGAMRPPPALPPPAHAESPPKKEPAGALAKLKSLFSRG